MTTYVQDRDGKYIPASQRPDGTWRKARRVKDGYIPQEEVPLYESKGKQFMKKPALPVGMCPIVAQQAKEKRQRQEQKQSIPGLHTLPNSDLTQKKKQQNPKPTSNGLTNNSATNKSAKKTVSSSIASTSITSSASTSKSKGIASTSTIPSQSIELCDDLQNLTISNDEELAKRIKKLRKKVREIESIESKIENGELKKPDPDQLEKIGRKNQILDQLNELERLESK